jgi:3-dehydroquinate synthase
LSHDVSLKLDYRHRVHFTRDAFDPANATLARLLQLEEPAATRALVVLDGDFAAHWPGLTGQIRHYWQARPESLPELAGFHHLPGGEPAKNDPTILQNLLESIGEAGLCRHSYLLAIGGGAVLDVAGFAAGIVHRGIRLLRMPTTTLAQDDAGVGVKNGINAFGKKNFLGTFAVPRAVVNDLRFLETLPDRAWRCGLSEAVKVALLKEPELFHRIAEHAPALARRDATVAEELWQASARLHVDHIATGGDPFEETRARPLDFGHWSAHRLEAMSDYALHHGEAVAIGIALDVTYTELAGRLDPEDAAAVRRCLEDLGFALHHPALHELDALMEGLEQFREHLGGQLTLTMLEGIGRPFEIHQIDRHTLAAAVDHLAEVAKAHPPPEPSV